MVAIRLSEGLGVASGSKGGLARLGGDEFTVLMPEIDGPDEAGIVAIVLPV